MKPIQILASMLLVSMKVRLNIFEWILLAVWQYKAAAKNHCVNKIKA